MKIKKISFLESLRMKGWKEGAEGWIPPAPATGKKKSALRAKAKSSKPSGEGMNSLEARYVVEILEKEITEGKAVKWFYESVKLRLAPKTTYTPDFMVIGADGEISFREVKGFLREDAAVKFKWARELYPYFSFKMITRKGGVWKEILHEVVEKRKQEDPIDEVSACSSDGSSLAVPKSKKTRLKKS